MTDTDEPANKPGGDVTELMKAVSRGDASHVGALLGGGVDVNAKDAFGNTALIFAAVGGHLEVAKTLLARGADAQAQNQVGLNASAGASNRGHEQIVQLLAAFSEGGLPEGTKAATGVGPEEAARLLLRAARDGEGDSVNELLAGGADVNARTGDGWTALMLATVKGHRGVFRSLIENGADLNARNDKEWTALHLAVSVGDAEIISLLLSGGAEINAADDAGATPLMLAASERNVESVRTLLASGADAQISNRQGETALSVAAQRGYSDLVELLIQAGGLSETAAARLLADVNARAGQSSDFDASTISRLKEEFGDFLKPVAAPGPGHLEPKGQALVAAARAAAPVVSDPVERLIVALEALRARQVVTLSVADKLMLTLPEAAALTSLSREHLRRAIKTGTLKARIIGRGWHIKRADLDEYIEEL